jgi:fructose-1,6-bisphosphatase II
MPGAILQTGSHEGVRVGPYSLAELEPVALKATRAAALACQCWIGRGSGDGADGAATGAMRAALANPSGLGTVVVGEGVKDEAPMLFDGEQLGAKAGFAFDTAVDPLSAPRCARRDSRAR